MSGVTAGGVVTAGVLCAVEGYGELGDEKQRGWPRRRRRLWCWGGRCASVIKTGDPAPLCARHRAKIEFWSNRRSSGHEGRSTPCPDDRGFALHPSWWV